jgi:hypothetical protein
MQFLVWHQGYIVAPAAQFNQDKLCSSMKNSAHKNSVKTNEGKHSFFDFTL